MADKNWNELGEEIKDAVNGAVSSGDFSELSKSIGDLVSSAVSNAADAVNKATDKTHQKAQAPNNGGDGTAAPALYVKKLQGLGGCISMMVIGYCMMVVGLIVVLLSAVLSIVSSVFIVSLFLFLVMAGAGLWMGISGSMRLAYMNRFRMYTRYIGWQLCVPIAALAQKCNRKVPAVIRDLQKMSEEHMFFEAHIDATEGFLLLSDKAYGEYLKTKEEAHRRQKEMERTQELRKQVQKEDAQLPEDCRKMIETGQSYINYIRSCNDAIPGEELSAKLDRMERLIGRIFDEVRKNPETASELEKMMNYYLPTTAKLLGTYCELDTQTETGENIIKTKKEIEDAIETLNGAFEKLLDSLFAERAWDISSDISVLHTMLAQEGLTESDFAK